MKNNMGNIDRVVRVAAAVLLLLAAFMQWVTGILAVIAVVLAVVFIGTSLVRFCPLYLPLGISTDKKE